MTQPDPISEARRIASDASDDDPTGWFERLYTAARSGAAEVPWDRGVPNPLLVAWVTEHSLDGHGLAALVVGGGLGADAEHLASRGFATTAFDVSPTATTTAQERFPGSRVEYAVADLLDPPSEWRGGYDLVLESLTVQSLPPAYHLTAIMNVTGFVAEGGTLLVIAGAREEGDWNGPPWPLTRAEIDAFSAGDLRLQHLERVPSSGEPWGYTWRVELRRDDA